MPADYKVITADKVDEFTMAEHGTFYVYALSLDGPSGVVSAKVNQKPETAAPQPGDDLHGDLEPDGRGGFKFKKKQRQGGGFPGGGGGGMTPEREAQIIRQHSQEMSVRWIDLLLRHGGELIDASMRERLLKMESLKAYADQFDQDAKAAAGKKA